MHFQQSEQASKGIRMYMSGHMYSIVLRLNVSSTVTLNLSGPTSYDTLDTTRVSQTVVP